MVLIKCDECEKVEVECADYSDDEILKAGFSISEYGAYHFFYCSDCSKKNNIPEKTIYIHY